MKASSLSLSAAVVKPHQKGEAYINLERTIDLNAIFSIDSLSPLVFSVYRANKSEEQDFKTALMCSEKENLVLTRTPRHFRVYTLSMLSKTGGARETVPLDFDGKKMSSLDLARFGSFN